MNPGENCELAKVVEQNINRSFDIQTLKRHTYRRNRIFTINSRSNQQANSQESSNTILQISILQQYKRVI